MIQLACRAPASRPAVRIASNSGSVSAGIIGDAMIRTGIPASDSFRITCNRRCGAGARGSIKRLSFASSVVTEMPTAANPRPAMSSKMSMSRSIRLPLVTIATG